MSLFDPKAYALHHQRVQKTFQAHRFLFDHVGHELTARLKDIKQNFSKALNLSPAPLPCSCVEHPCLEESMPFPEGPFDLVLSCLYLQWVNDVPAYLKRINDCLSPEGLFLGAFWGGQTLFELRESLLQAEVKLKGGASPRVASFMHPADAPRLLGKTGFVEPVVDTETIRVAYPSLFQLMRDLRGMGETNKLVDRPKNFTSRSLFDLAEDIYRETYAGTSDTVPATFEVIYITAWKK